MGSVGTTTPRSMPWVRVYQTYRQEVEAATELHLNPDTGHAVFMANEGPVTPIISDFLENQSGTDEAFQRYYQSLYPRKTVRIVKSKYI